ncbi:uncharacterized protein LOC115751646 [Rhodamnia argentea]|uniref:Uncharacterized protein LOC115751646 n=1 Tax=Rhodamnia argentea TaxID=178133 RepID=A0A8B8QEB1_9MYRT|nr:uncharacterized protein LOC115751646 [Rhodamnia argentea]XP_030545457.1 uncharacterized protein LOC115751646 [Rhodamnia argentea]
MELRSCIHLHSIQAIKNGHVTKVLNVTHGRPALSFKKVADLCGSRDVKEHINFRKFEPKDELDVSDFDDDDDVRGGLYPDMVGRKTTQSNLNCSKFSRVDEKNSLLDDFCLRNMTLNQIKERCKMQKRKRFLCEDSSAIDDDSRTPKREAHSHSLSEEAELDLEEPLIKWIAKIKNFKGKKVSPKKCRDSSCQRAKVVVRAEQIPSPQPTLQSDGNLLMPISVKVEDEAHDYDLNSQAGVGAPRDSLAAVNGGQSSSSVAVSGEVPNLANESYQDNLISVAEESEICGLNKVPYEDVDRATLASESSNLDVAISVVSYLEVPRLNYHESDIHKSEARDKACHTNFLSLEAPSQSSVNGFCCNPNSCEDYLSTHTMTLHLSSSSPDPDGSSRSSQPTKQPCGDDVGMSQDDAGENMLYDHERISKKSIVCDCNSACNANLNPSCAVCSDSPIDVEKQSHICTGDDDAEISCTADPPCDVADYPTTLQMFEKFSQLELHCARGGLFSARKVISPTSQERLRKLMGATESNDDCYGYKGKLYSQKQMERSSVGVERFKLVRRAELPPNPKHKKLKGNKKGSPPKGSHKDFNLSGTVPRINSTQSCSQNAIAFSQRQMQDIDNLATKLMTELNVMTDIVEGNSCADSCLTGTTKYTTYEVKTAIENASKVKETARKWLSMMSRDCNRFCKIMRSTEDCNPMMEHRVHKERKKITFADEAGGELCHVKYIEDSMASLLASDNEKEEATVE